MRDRAWTLAEENWAQAIAKEIRKRIEWGPYVDKNAQTPVYMHDDVNPFNPDKFSLRQLEDLLRRIENEPEPDLHWFGTLFGVKDPHA